MKQFYRIVPNQDGSGTVDVWLSPGQPVPIYDTLTGLLDYNIKVLAVRGIREDDPQYGGDLEEHIRRNYYAWMESAEEVEI